MCSNSVQARWIYSNSRCDFGSPFVNYLFESFECEVRVCVFCHRPWRFHPMTVSPSTISLLSETFSLQCLDNSDARWLASAQLVHISKPSDNLTWLNIAVTRCPVDGRNLKQPPGCVLVNNGREPTNFNWCRISFINSMTFWDKGFTMDFSLIVYWKDHEISYHNKEVGLHVTTECS